MQKVKRYLSRVTIAMAMLLFTLSFQSCDDPKDSKSPAGNWLVTEHYLNNEGDVDTASTLFQEEYIHITESSFEYHLKFNTSWHYVALTQFKCDILDEKMILSITSDSGDDFIFREMYYSYEGDELLLESVTYPENSWDHRYSMTHYDGNLPPEHWEQE